MIFGVPRHAPPLAWAVVAIAAASTPARAEPSPVALLYLRPTRDANLKVTQLDRIAEAQRLRTSAEAALADVSGRTVRGHEALREVLGAAYLVELFECAGDERCVAKRASALTARGVTEVVVGEYATVGKKYRVQLRKLDLSTPRPAEKVTFEVVGAELDSPTPWRQPLAPWFSSQGAIRLVANATGFRCTLDGVPCALDSASRIASVKRGEHVLALEKDGFQGVTTLVSVASGAEVAVQVTFEPVVAAAPRDAGVSEASAEATVDLSGHAPPTGRTARATFTARPVVIDGHLDDAAWVEAAVDDRFVSTSTNPRGEPTTTPTSFQLAFDDDHLYVAVRANDSPGVVDDTTVPNGEWGIWDVEAFCVAVDADHGHTNARLFCLTRGGYRADGELSGTQELRDDWRYNMEWRGLWRSAVERTPTGWVAEMEIPWGTLRLGAHDGPFVLPLNVNRWVPSRAEENEWSLSPAGYWPMKASHFGHVEMPRGVRAGQRVYVAPFISALVESGSAQRSLLRGFVSPPGPFSAYAGLDARVRPFGPLQLDLTVNPDFISALPDALQSPLDRFELFFPENRDFFNETSTTYQFGTANSLLFYSRRVGLKPGANGGELPVIYGANAAVRTGGFEAGVLNVSTSDDQRFAFAENVTVARAQHYFTGNARVGGILLNSANSEAGSRYRAYGVDGTVGWFNSHLRLSGSAVRTDTLDASSGYSAQGNVTWVSQTFDARASYLFVDRAFDARLGYFPVTGVHRADVYAAYKVNAFTDGVRLLTFDGTLSRTLDLSGQLFIDKQEVHVGALLDSWATIDLRVTRSVDLVTSEFTLATGRLKVATGSYDTLLAKVGFHTAPGQFSLDLDYSEGTFFGGYRRSPAVIVRTRFGKVNGRFMYQLSMVQLPGQPELIGHLGRGTAIFAYTPYIRSTLSVDVNSFDIGSIAQFNTSWMFGKLSSLSLVLSTRFFGVDQRFAFTDTSAVLKFAYGFTAL